MIYLYTWSKYDLCLSLEEQKNTQASLISIQYIKISLNKIFIILYNSYRYICNYIEKEVN